VACCVGVDVAEVAAAVAAGVAAAGVVPAVPISNALWFDVICGGVIVKTAPKLPKAPPVINSARFIPELSLAYL
jgi:hypothetical protein